MFLLVWTMAQHIWVDLTMYFWLMFATPLPLLQMQLLPIRKTFHIRCSLTIKPITNFPLLTFLSTSVCFKQSCWRRLWGISIVALLLQQVLIDSRNSNLSSNSKALIQRISPMLINKDQNSPSTLDLATTFCFLYLNISWPPSKEAYSWYDSYTPKRGALHFPLLLHSDFSWF